MADRDRGWDERRWNDPYRFRDEDEDPHASGRDHGGWYGRGEGRTDQRRSYTDQDRRYGYAMGNRDEGSTAGYGADPRRGRSTYAWPESSGRWPQGDYGRGEQHRREAGFERDDERREGRGFFSRAADEVASWLGSEDAQRRREQDHRGRGPKGYKRSDSRIEEDVNDRLTDDPRLDASEIQVHVHDREVTLTGNVGSRADRRRAEDVAESVPGVTYVMNNLRVRQHGTTGAVG